MDGLTFALDEYFRENFSKNICDHTIRVTNANEKETHFYMHPLNVNGETLAFVIKGANDEDEDEDEDDVVDDDVVDDDVVVDDDDDDVDVDVDDVVMTSITEAAITGRRSN